MEEQIETVQRMQDYEDYCQAIEEIQEVIAKNDPQVIDAQRDSSNPRIQLEPIGTRGYIELHPLKGVND